MNTPWKHSENMAGTQSDKQKLADKLKACLTHTNTQFTNTGVGVAPPPLTNTGGGGVAPFQGWHPLTITGNAKVS